jgi:hypothetical protein
MNPNSELVRLYSSPVRLKIYTPEEKSLGAHEIIVRLNEPIRITDDIGPHAT